MAGRTQDKTYEQSIAARRVWPPGADNRGGPQESRNAVSKPPISSEITDPELIEVFDNFAFDEVLAQSKLDTKTRIMMILGSLIASQAVSEYKIMAGAALNVGITPVEIKEILYQSVPYVGMARAFDFLHATNEVLTSRGVSLPLEGQSTTTPETRYEKGLASQKAIFGKIIDQLYEQSPKDQLHIQRFLSAHCFGDSLHPQRTGHQSQGACDPFHPDRPGRRGIPDQGPHPGQPERRQRPRRADGPDHPTAALGRLSPHPERPEMPERSGAPPPTGAKPYDTTRRLGELLRDRRLVSRRAHWLAVRRHHPHCRHPGRAG